MAWLTFYKSVRADGGVRFGVSFGETELLERFQPGPDNDDPRLQWQFEARCKGRGLPTAALDARNWWLVHAEPFKHAIHELVELFEKDLSPDDWPYLYKVSNSPKGMEMVLYICAIRRYPGRTIAKELMRFHDEWNAELKQMPAVAAESVGA